MRASVCSGNFGGKDNRAWRADSFADDWEAWTGGEGSWSGRFDIRGISFRRLEPFVACEGGESDGWIVDCKRQENKSV